VGQRGVFEVGDDLLDDGVVAVGGLGGEHRLAAVGEHGVVAVDRERFGLSGRDGGRVQAPHAAHDQPGGDVFGAATAGERGELDFSDFGIGHEALFIVVPDRVGVADRVHPWSGMVVIALVTAGVRRAVTENRAPARRAAAMIG
jgi:hypothetical protein